VGIRKPDIQIPETLKKRAFPVAVFEWL
jgi:hypothetical protein